LKRISAVTRGSGAALHCDGARIWNACAATGESPATYGSLFDTLSVCLSKGLGAPVGSVLVGSAERVAAARALRRGLGGGWRQAGILAAAGLVAVRDHRDRLVDDHWRAKRLATQIAQQAPGVTDPRLVETNIVSLDLSAAALDAPALAASARDAGVLLSVVGRRRARAVLHLDVGEDDVDRAVEVVGGLLAPKT
jgi:threonine aldolase